MRTRDWRRAQRERIRHNRRRLFTDLWSWSSADYIDRVWRCWSKVNPGTKCSCWMCSYPSRPDAAPEIPFRIRPGLFLPE